MIDEINEVHDFSNKKIMSSTYPQSLTAPHSAKSKIIKTSRRILSRFK
jgi:hypothetical protein